MDKILVLSITRMGDIVQSIPFFRRLRLKHPDAEIHMLVEDCFADVAELVPGVDKIHRVRVEDLMAGLSTGNGRLSGSFKFYKDWIDLFRAANYSQVWNLTHTRPSTVMNYLLAGERGMGVTLDRDGFQRVNSVWLSYFFAANLARPWCQFNLVDVYANCITGVPWDAGRSIRFPDAVLSRFDTRRLWQKSASRAVALHPGASQNAKQWPLEYFKKAAVNLLNNKDLELVIIGGAADSGIIGEFEGIPGIVNLIGKTTPGELAAVLSDCDLIITNDSGPMHVAAAAGAKVIAVTVGTALARETAPYGEGHLVVEPDIACFPCNPNRPCPSNICARSITPDMVVKLAEWMLDGDRVQPQETGFSGIRVYRTNISSADGMLDLQRLFSGVPSDEDILNQLARPVWLAVLENRPPPELPSPVPVDRALMRRIRMALDLVREALRIIDGMRAEAAVKNPDLHKVRRFGDELKRREDSLTREMGCHGLLNSLWTYISIARGSLKSPSLSEQIDETRTIYYTLRQMLSYLINISGNNRKRKYLSQEIPHESDTQRLRTPQAC